MQLLLFLDYVKNLCQRIVNMQITSRFRYRHLRKREFEKFLRIAFGFSRKKSVKWAKYIK